MGIALVTEEQGTGLSSTSMHNFSHKEWRSHVWAQEPITYHKTTSWHKYPSKFYPKQTSIDCSFSTCTTRNGTSSQCHCPYCVETMTTLYHTIPLQETSKKRHRSRADYSSTPQSALDSNLSAKERNWNSNDTVIPELRIFSMSVWNKTHRELPLRSGK